MATSSHRALVPKRKLWRGSLHGFVQLLHEPQVEAQTRRVSMPVAAGVGSP